MLFYHMTDFPCTQFIFSTPAENSNDFIQDRNSMNFVLSIPFKTTMNKGMNHFFVNF